MASKRRVRRRQCERKIRYDSREQAAAAIRSVIRAGRKCGGFLHAYYCHFCSGYHFGHAKR